MRICIAIILLAFLIPALDGKQIEVVIFNGASINKKNGEIVLKNFPGAPLEKEYSIKCHRYWPDKKIIKKLLAKTGKIKLTQWREKHPQYRSCLDESFLENLSNARLLYIGQYNHESQELFNKYLNEIKTFLSKGGIIFFDYLGGVQPGLNKFLDSVNVQNPCSNWKTHKKDFIADYYVLGINPKCEKLSLLNTPWKIRKINAYGWWTNWSDKQIVPFQNPKYPEKSASMIIQEDVMGKGKVVFNSVASIFRAPISGGNKKILQNTLSYIIGKNILDYKKEMLEDKGGPGEPAIYSISDL
jgi:hypothetical protein